MLSIKSVIEVHLNKRWTDLSVLGGGGGGGGDDHFHPSRVLKGPSLGKL